MVWQLLVVIVTHPVDKKKTVVLILGQNVLLNMMQEVYVFSFLKKLKEFSLFQQPQRCLGLLVTHPGIQNFEGLDHLAGTLMNSEKFLTGLYNDVKLG